MEPCKIMPVYVILKRDIVVVDSPQSSLNFLNKDIVEMREPSFCQKDITPPVH
eukprot:TRINITY_DN2432_c0_g1_i1.p3 TRINITY_DN2432_c0_g1~~TRINITY_DN2432_c0_g1_i1.p3  ORF type:complete len:53 (+),score=6.52 TRINITY_DN2432_c0_g1_i1:176-334(+)